MHAALGQSLQHDVACLQAKFILALQSVSTYGQLQQSIG